MIPSATLILRGFVVHPCGAGGLVEKKRSKSLK